MQAKYVALGTLTGMFLAVVVAKQLNQDETLTGSVTRVRDGKTIEVADAPIRLNGVAAPALEEPFGREAQAFLTRLVFGRTVTCELNGQRTLNRAIGVCYLDGQDIAASIIAAGLARDCARHSGGQYDEFNTTASKRLPLPDYCGPR
ncbi:MAG: thermonuclease family protein [Alphaproteobacteria bacterium]|nr:thermonuclease family protein [Alphaproteobacteria bacterium]